jgi:hypothetical protein
MGIVTGLHFFPLQSNNLEGFASTFKSKTTSLNDAIFFAIGVGVFIVILVIVQIIRTKFKVPILNGVPSPASAPRQFSVFTLHRLANGIGLDREQTKMLEFVLKSDGVTDPARSIDSPSLLDRHFKRAYRLIERTAITEDEVQEKLSVLFATRNIIESNMGNVNTTSTRQIPENAMAVLTVEQQNYQVRVISSRGDTLVVENPMDMGSPLRLPRGSKVTLAFFTKTSKGFSVESRILNSTETADGPVLQLVHSGQIKRLSNRRFRRRQTVIATAFYFVHIEATGRRKEQKMAVDKRRLTGNIMDISIGGCSIKTSAPVTSGQRLKIEFTREDSSAVAALGQVLRTNRTGTSTIMHVKFLKIPRRSLNMINAMVYEYAE